MIQCALKALKMGQTIMEVLSKSFQMSSSDTMLKHATKNQLATSGEAGQVHIIALKIIRTNVGRALTNVFS